MTNTIPTLPEPPTIDIIDLDSYKSKGNSWMKARYIENNELIENITPIKLYNMVNILGDYRDKALIILAYFTAGRIEEIVRYQKIVWGKKQAIVIHKGKRNKRQVQDWTQKQKIGEVQHGIMKKDIRIESIKGIPCVVVRLRNLKNKKDNTKKLPIRLDRDYNLMLWRILETYLKTIEGDFTELFPFGMRNAERIINKINWNPHSLRKLRLTHLAIYENFTDQKLKYYAGWTDSRPAKYYIKLRYDDLI